MSEAVYKNAVYKLEALSVAMGELEVLWTKKHAAGEAFKAACESVAQQSGLDPAVVRAYITARMTDKLEAQQQKAQQLSLVFSEVE